ncbi:MAG: MlaD family protein [Rhodococcus sp. (in: high G+C Gram-positive bacteria)]
MRRPLLVPLSLFVVTAVVALFVGASYVIGPQTLRGAIELNATTADATNLAVGAGVTYRGVAVGTVDRISIAADGSGVDLTLSLDPDTQVPVGSTAKVTNSSALGIQTLDIVPIEDDGRYLVDGDTIELPPEDRPQQLDELLVDVSTLAESIDPDAVTKVTDTLGAALDDNGPALASLLDDADTLTRMLDARAPALARITESGLPLLSAVAEQADTVSGSVAAVRDITGQLLAQEPTLIYLLERSPEALARTSQLLDETRGTVGALMTNLVSISTVLGDRTPAMAALLTALPDTLGELTSIVDGDRGAFTLVGTQGPACWYDTPRRVVGDTSPRAPNLNLYCPPGPALAQRGSQNAPRPNDLGLSGATEPGNVSGPPIADEPLLVPTGVEALDYWKKLMEGVAK